MTDSTQATEVNLINIKGIIKSKIPKLYRILPDIVFRYIIKVIHQDELNRILTEHQDKEGLEFINGALDIMQITHSAKGAENIPGEGRFIFAANHPLGGLDGMVFIKEVGKKFPDLKFPVNDLLFNIKNLRSIFLPINKLGGLSRESVQQIEEAYKSDSQILQFPAGLCSRKVSGEIIDLEWKKHFIIKAIQHKRDIIPVFFKGRNSNFFYNLANLRQFLRIKFNIEMFYLFNEMFMQKDKEIHIRFGKPVSYRMFDRSRSQQEWANMIKKMVYSMSSGNDISADN